MSRYGLVCRAWRQASRQLPQVVELKRPLQADQIRELLASDQQICGLAFAEGDAAALDILQDPGFCRRQVRPHLRNDKAYSLSGQEDWCLPTIKTG